MHSVNIFAWRMIRSENRYPPFGIMRLTLHKIDILNRDRTAVAVIGDENGEPDRSFCSGNRQHDQRIDLTDDVAEKARERDQIDVDGEQNELDRHQDDDDVLAIKENSHHAEREQDRADREIVTK